MAQIVANCPRCRAGRSTFDVLSQTATRSQWHETFEIFCICRHCRDSTVFIVRSAEPQYFTICREGLSRQGADVTHLLRIEGYVNIRHTGASRPPDHLPKELLGPFSEGATCLAVECFNGAGAMFRLCLDLATTGLLPPEGQEGSPNAKTRRDLGLRLPWLFDNGKLPEDLRDLSTCVREDGNDAAHRGSLTKQDAFDLLDFTHALLERLYTVPERLRQAADRRQTRRATPKE